MNSKQQVLSIGEILVDFVSTESGKTLKDAPAFVKCAGGAPANVAVGIARLGTPSSFAGKVGDDPFGRFLVSEMRSAGVDTSGIQFDPHHKTRLAFVSLKNDGDREFEFWESQPADEHLEYSDIRRDLLKRSSIVNIGSFLLVKTPSREAVLHAAQYARKLGKHVCYDPNLRLSLWKNFGEAKRVMAAMIVRSTIVRLNDEEAFFFTRTRDLKAAAQKLRGLGPRLVVVTRGAKGCYFQTAQCSGYVPGFKVRVVDTTGCGDGFLAGLLHGLAQKGENLDGYSSEELRSICEVANAVGALVARKRGGIAAMPSRKEMRGFLKRRKAR